MKKNRQPYAIRYTPYAKSGIASLPAILLLGTVIIEVAIAGVFLLSYLNNTVYGARLSNQAIIAARSGVNDAVWRIILNKNCGADTSCAPLYPATYDISVGSATAQVSICKDTCISGKHQVVSIGRAATRQRRIVATILVDSVTGLVTVESLKDTPQ